MKRGEKSIAFKKILVPIDFSSYSDQALNYAATISKKFNAQVILMHVIESLPYSVTDSLVLIDHKRALETTARSLLDNWSKKLREKKVAVTTFLVSGVAYHEIIKKARQEKVDLIVMGTHGRTGLEHLLLGSVAEKVLRLCACPVLTVRLPAAESKSKLSRRPSTRGTTLY